MTRANVVVHLGTSLAVSVVALLVMSSVDMLSVLHRCLPLDVQMTAWIVWVVVRPKLMFCTVMNALDIGVSSMRMSRVQRWNGFNPCMIVMGVVTSGIAP